MLSNAMSNATVVFCDQDNMHPPATAIRNIYGTPISACESRETTTAGPSDISKQAVTMIPSYDLQGAERFIMPALSGPNDASYNNERDFGIQEQLAGICQVRIVRRFPFTPKSVFRQLLTRDRWCPRILLIWMKSSIRISKTDSLFDPASYRCPE